MKKKIKKRDFIELVNKEVKKVVMEFGKGDEFTLKMRITQRLLRDYIPTRK